MIISRREVVGSPVEQGKDEAVIYTITLQAAGAVTNILATVWELQDNGGYTDTTTTNMPVNIPSATTTTIQLSPLLALASNTAYRVEVNYTQGGQVFEPYFVVNAER